MSGLRKSNSGFSAIEILLVLVTLALVGMAGFFVAKHIDNTKKPVVANSQPPTRTSKASSPAITQDPDAGNLVIKELGVQLPATDPALTGLSYTVSSNKAFYNDDRVVISLVTDKIAAITCTNVATPKGAFNQNIFVFQQEAAADASQAAGPAGVKHIGSNYYAYDGSTGDGGCVLTAADQATLNAFRQATLASFMSLSAS